jgi:hypothetical protein
LPLVRAGDRKIRDRLIEQAIDMMAPRPQIAAAQISDRGSGIRLRLTATMVKVCPSMKTWLFSVGTGADPGQGR